MANSISPLLPSTLALLVTLGERLQLARKRRRLTATQVAERAGMTRTTLRAVEGGSPGVTMGAYLAVLQVLGLESDFAKLADADPLGRELQDAALTQSRTRVPVSAKKSDAVIKKANPKTAVKTSKDTSHKPAHKPGQSKTQKSTSNKSRTASLASLIQKRPVSQRKKS